MSNLWELMHLDPSDIFSICVIVNTETIKDKTKHILVKHMDTLTFNYTDTFYLFH